jgi:iron complex transport system ATP-binding protein
VAWFCDTTVVLGPLGLLAKGDPREVISQNLMDTIYPNTCQVKDNENFKMVVPSGLTRDPAKVVKFPLNPKGEKRYGTY